MRERADRVRDESEMNGSGETSTDTGLAAIVDRDGCAIVPDVVSPERCDEIGDALAESSPDGAGTRDMLSRPAIRDLAAHLRKSEPLSAILPPDFVAVQCTFFRKSQERNWLVARHQDLTIPVAERVSHPDLTGWSDKEGGAFVHPPTAFLERLIAVRLHLDDCGENNGPLRVRPGTHRLGRLSQEDLDAAANRAREVVCVVPRGGVLVMKPLLIHASSKSSGRGERRVLHFLFAPANPPCGLRWARVA